MCPNLNSIFYSIPNFSAEKKVIPAKGKALVDTQISIAVPIGTYGRVAPRSGLGENLFNSKCVLSDLHLLLMVSIKIHD